MKRVRHPKITNEQQLAAAGVSFPPTITFEGEDYAVTRTEDREEILQLAKLAEGSSP